MTIKSCGHIPPPPPPPPPIRLLMPPLNENLNPAKLPQVHPTDPQKGPRCLLLPPEYTLSPLKFHPAPPCITS